MDYSDYSDHSPTSFVSWATNVTKCSNPVFDSVLRRNWTNSSMQQDVLTVLTGITKLIQDNNGKESGAEYYAALLTALNTSSTTKSAEAYLLKLIISKAIPDSLLRVTFAEASKIIINVLSSSAPENPETPSILKSLLVCLGRLLRAQRRDAWSTESVRHIYRYVLRFVDNDKPAVRKASHSAVVDILVGNSEVENDSAFQFHPACHQTQDHLCSSLRRESRQLIALLHTKESHCTRLLHCLELLSSVLHVMPMKDVKTSCECILELVDFPNPLVVGKSFDSIRTLFENQPSTSSLSIELTARLLTALYASRPNDPAIFTIPTVVSHNSQTSGFTGLEVLIAWVRCVRSGCAYLCSLCNTAVQSGVSANQTLTGCNMSLSRLLGEHLDRLIKALIDILTSTPLPKLRKLISVILDEVFMNELDNQLLTDDFQKAFPTLLPSIACQLRECLNLSRSEVWPYALLLSARLLRIWPQHGNALSPSDIDSDLCKLLKHVAHLRDALVDGPASLYNLISSGVIHDSSTPQLTNLDEDLGNVVIDELDRVCLVALETLGPDLVLNERLIPLEPIIIELESGSVDLRRSWILPLLARVIPKTPCRLNFFTKHLLPLADRALVVAKTAVATMASKEINGNKGSAALITAGITVTRQIWAGLAMFVRQAPEDWSELSAGGLGRRLVNELANTSALRATILMAFRRLSLAAQKSEAGLVAMRGGAKLAIPTMLSLYENAEPSAHSPLQQQIRATLAAYFPCLTNKMIASPAALAYQKLTSTQNPVYMEILQIVVPHTSTEEIAAFLTKLAPYLSSASCQSRVLQKRAYRLLELVCSGATESTRQYLTENLDVLLDLLHSLNNSPPTTEPTPKISMGSKPNLPADELSDQLASLSFAGLSKAGKNKKGRTIVPWKPRLRCLYHLLCYLVAQEQSTLEEKDNNTQVTQSNDSMQNTRLRNFANMFLPEILAAMCEVNRIVRDLAGRLLINLVMAFAGRAPISASSLPGGQSATAILDTKTVHSGNTNRSLSSDGSDVDARSEKSTSSIGGFTCADEDEIRSTLSMPRGGPQSVQVCNALNLVISRLWGCLPPHVPIATNPSELAMQESAGRVVCHLLRHLRFRRALALTLSSDSDMGEKIASGILSEAAVAAQHLTAAPHRELARAGLQLIRLLMAFVSYAAVGLVDLVQALQGLHKTQKRPLRFGVKAILEKMIKKFGRKTIQGMTNAEYQKVVRNSARIMARRERLSSEARRIQKESELSVDDTCSVRSKADTRVPGRTSIKLSGTMSVHSHVSLPPRVHMPRFGELLAQSSDEDDDRALSRRGTPSVRSTVSSKRSQLKDAQPKSLVEELESVAETDGLCRRARKRALRRQAGADDSGDSDVTDDHRTALVGSKRRVRFADTTSLTSTNRLTAKHSRRAGVAETTNKVSDLWLVEDNPDTGDILDLSDPKALARHTAFASDAETAKAMTNAFRAAAAARKPTRSSTSTPFSMVNGKIVIDESSKTKSQEFPDADWSLHGSDDEENESGPPSGWDHQANVATRSSKSSKVRIPGREYASSKAHGDMRRPGQPDPYAYISLGAGLGASSRKATTAQERRRLLRAVGMGKKKRKHAQIAGPESSSRNTHKSRRKSGIKTGILDAGARGIRRKLSVQ